MAFVPITLIGTLYFFDKSDQILFTIFPLASILLKTFNRLKTHAHRNPITASNLLRQEMYNDHTKYFDNVMNIKEHNRVESVTLWNDDVPTTLTVQEYRDSI